MNSFRAEKLDDGYSRGWSLVFGFARMRLLATDYISDEHNKNCINYLNQWGYDIKEGGEIPSRFLSISESAHKRVLNQNEFKNNKDRSRSDENRRIRCILLVLSRLV